MKSLQSHFLTDEQELTDDKLTSQRSHIPQIPPSQLQGECRVKSISILKLSILRAYVFQPILCLLSCFIIIPVMERNPRFKAKLIMKNCSPKQAEYVLVVGHLGVTELVKCIRKEDCVEFFYLKVKYRVDAVGAGPVCYNLSRSPVFHSNNRFKSTGLSQIQSIQHRQAYGECEQTIDIPPLFGYLIYELTGPFFIMQYLTCFLYMLADFFMFSAIIIIMSLLTTLVNYYLLRKSYIRLKIIAQKNYLVEVLREGRLRQIPSKQLVPGDVFRPSGPIPCDCILIQGFVYVNESSLTGESVPIAKTPFGSNKLEEKNWIYEKSEVLEKRSENCLALVVHTGFLTRKGRIIRRILFKTNSTSNFVRQGVYFLLGIALVCIPIYFITLPTMIRQQLAIKLIVLRFFDMLTWAIPPTLPIFFNICFSCSLERLRRQNIMGTDPEKTVASGRMKTVCFDKTGTLTQNRMEIRKVFQLADEEFRDFDANGIQKSSELITMLMGACHSVRLIRNQLQGDQLDLRMFVQSGYNLNDSQNNQYNKGGSTLQVLKLNQFQSKHQSMSVIVREVSNNSHFLFVKGAPEKIAKSTKNVAGSLQPKVEELCLGGYRVLAMGFKEIAPAQLSEYMSRDREDLETDLEILGLVAFENKLKTDCVDLTLKLGEADIDMRMITGDNLYIAVETAVRAGIVPLKQDMDTEVWILCHQNLLNHTNQVNVKILSASKQEGIKFKGKRIITIEQIQQIDNYIAVDEAFYLEYFHSGHIFLPNQVKVFARITPENKAAIVSILKKQQTSKKPSSFIQRLTVAPQSNVAMVGDGANDIMAIRQADLGIGISECDGSFAATFTIECLSQIQVILKEGRCSLQTMVEIFLYYGSTSLLKFALSIILLSDKSALGDSQFTYYSYAGSVIICLLMCLSGPKPGECLSKRRPNDNPIHLQNYSLYLGLTIIPSVCFGLAKIILYKDSGFIPNPDLQPETWGYQSQLNSAIFMCSQIFVVGLAVCFYQARPWKQPLHRNLGLATFLVVMSLVSTSLFLFKDNILTRWLGLVALPNKFSLYLLLLTFAFVVVCQSYATLINWLFRRRQQN